jgi:hypothetical protein
MDPLHPLVPIQPAPPVPPDYTRVQRIERDQQRESEPDWQHSSDEEDEGEQRDEQFEDDYDPDWSDTAAAETYNDHGELTESPGTGESTPAAPKPWNPRLQAERRARPRPSDEPDDEEPGPHIDIIA